MNTPVSAVDGSAQVDDPEQILGPVDYVVVEFPDLSRLDGSALDHLLALVRADVIRILDLSFIQRVGDTVTYVEFEDIDHDGTFDAALFAQSHTGILGVDDLAEAGAAVDPGHLAAVLVYENHWAAPFVGALRRNGAEFVASGRIPVPELLAALDEVDDTTEEK